MSVEGIKKGSKREKIQIENIRREDLIRLNWVSNWQWYVDLLREREKVIANYKKSSPKALALGALEESDERTVLPFPQTTSQNYGWLSTRKEFQLEVFGAYYVKLKVSPNSADASSSLFYSTTEK